MKRPSARAIAWCALALCGSALLIAAARRADPVPSVGDTAIIESYVWRAAHGGVLVGPYSRFQWHHPGPLLFYALAPFYVLSGFRTAGLSAGAAAINILALAGILWTAARARTAFLPALLAPLLLYVVRTAGILASPWNPHVLILPLMLLMVTAAASVATPAALPALAVLAAFEIQTHVGVAPAVLAAVLFALAASGCRARASPDERERRRFLRYASVAAAATLLLWMPAVIEQFSHSPGNLARLWRFFMEGGHAPQAFGPAFGAWAGAFTGVVRPSFGVAWGGGPPSPAAPSGEVWAVLQCALLVPCGIMAWRDGRVFSWALAAIVLVTAAASFWAVTRIRGDIIDHEVFWISAIGALGLAVVIDAVLHALRVSSSPVPIVRAIAGAVAAVLFATALVEFHRSLVSPHGSESEEAAVGAFSTAIAGRIGAARSHRLLLEIDGASWGTAAGLIVELDKRKIPVSVGSGAVWMFGDWMAPSGEEDLRVAISAAERHAELAARPGTETIAARAGFFADALTGAAPLDR